VIDYATQSRISDPGPFAARLAEVGGELSAMRAAAGRLVFHYRDGGDYAENGIEPGRIAEIDTRFARDMLARIFQLSDRPLTADRAPNQRIVGCCRDVTLLFLALARQHSVRARARVGFAAYFMPGWFVDHVIAEVWDAGQQRWRMVDPELADDHVDESDGTRIDPLDLPAGRFLTGPQAWRSCRAGSADPDRFVVDPGLAIPHTRGWPQVRHNLIQDLASLAKHEMLLWEDWGLDHIDGEPTQQQLDLLDQLAEVTSSPGVSAGQVMSYFERDEFRVPPVVTSHSPAHDGPRQVAV
jgi:Transglutaminase-like superfamily